VGVPEKSTLTPRLGSLYRNWFGLTGLDAVVGSPELGAIPELSVEVILLPGDTGDCVSASRVPLLRVLLQYALDLALELGYASPVTVDALSEIRYGSSLLRE
jgi:hypothetical protein